MYFLRLKTTLTAVFCSCWSFWWDSLIVHSSNGCNSQSSIFGFPWCCGKDSRRFDRLLWFAYPFSSWSLQSHPGFALTSQVWSDPHPHGWMTCLRFRTAVYFLESRIPFYCHSPLACWKSSSPVLSHNSQWQWLGQFDSWNEWVWMTGKLDRHQHSLGPLGGALLWYGIGQQHRWWTAQGQVRIPVVLQWSAHSFLKEWFLLILAGFFELDMTWTISNRSTNTKAGT